jgi:hypothetical protein
VYCILFLLVSVRVIADESMEHRCSSGLFLIDFCDASEIFFWAMFRKEGLTLYSLLQVKSGGNIHACMQACRPCSSPATGLISSSIAWRNLRVRPLILARMLANAHYVIGHVEITVVNST